MYLFAQTKIYFTKGNTSPFSVDEWFSPPRYGTTLGEFIANKRTEPDHH